MDAELSHPGDGSSGALTHALTGAGLALTKAYDAPSLAPGAMAAPTGQRGFRALTPRHRRVLVVQELLRGITVDPGDGPADQATVQLDGAEVVTLILPRDDLAFWQGQVNTLLAMRWSRDERLDEIYLQQTDILSFVAQTLNIGALSHPWTMEFLDTILAAVFEVEAQVKRVFSLPRPVVVAPAVAPVIQTPGHSAFPSGHATEAFCLASVLGAVATGAQPVLLREAAARVAENRSYAGVHYPVDSHGGAVLGDALAGVFLARALGRSMPGPRPVFEPKPQETEPEATPPYGADVMDFALNHDAPQVAGAGTGTAVGGMLGLLVDNLMSEWA